MTVFPRHVGIGLYAWLPLEWVRVGMVVVVLFDCNDDNWKLIFDTKQILIQKTLSNKVLVLATNLCRICNNAQAPILN